MLTHGGAKATAPVWKAVRRRVAEEDGFTMAELVVFMAVSLIVLAALTTLFVAGIRVQSYMQNRFDAQQNARLALDKLRREIHCASAVGTTTFPTSSVTFTVGGYCPTSDKTTLTAALTVPASGSYSIAVASTAPFPAPSGSPATVKVYVGSSGRIDCTGPVAATSVSGCTGGAAGTYAVGTSVAATNTYTWCTTGSGARYALYRYRGGSCSGTGTRWADYLTTGTVFPASTQNCSELRTVSVDLPINVKPAQAGQRYQLKDDIVLRNSGRTPC